MSVRVLFVITGLSMGGAENVVINLADALSERGHSVKIAYLTGDALVLPSSSNIEIISIGMKNVKGFFVAYMRIKTLIKDFQPDVVHSHMFHANILSRLVRLIAKIPRLVCTAHSNNEGGKIRMLAYRMTDKLADISTNVSEGAVESFIKKKAVSRNRMVSVANGVNTREYVFSTLNRREKRKEIGLENKNFILAVGRLVPAKDYFNLLNAIYLLKAVRQDFKVFIVGDGPLRKDLLTFSKSLKIQDFVEFLGVRRDIPALMAASDIFTLSSAWEGFGLVVAEAMSCERVVVATDCGGVSEVVGSAGFLVPTRNSKVLAEKLSYALSLDIKEKNIIGATARQRIINDFSLDKNVESFLKLYSV